MSMNNNFEDAEENRTYTEKVSITIDERLLFQVRQILKEKLQRGKKTNLSRVISLLVKYGLEAREIKLAKKVEEEEPKTKSHKTYIAKESNMSPSVN